MQYTQKFCGVESRQYEHTGNRGGAERYKETGYKNIPTSTLRMYICKTNSTDVEMLCILSKQLGTPMCYGYDKDEDQNYIEIEVTSAVRVRMELV